MFLLFCFCCFVLFLNVWFLLLWVIPGYYSRLGWKEEEIAVCSSLLLERAGTKCWVLGISLQRTRPCPPPAPGETVPAAVPRALSSVTKTPCCGHCLLSTASLWPPPFPRESPFGSPSTPTVSRAGVTCTLQTPVPAPK